jgi:hypothetical protein
MYQRRRLTRLWWWSILVLFLLSAVPAAADEIGHEIGRAISEHVEVRP